MKETIENEQSIANNEQLGNKEENNNLEDLKNQKYEFFDKIFSTIKNDTSEIYILSKGLSKKGLTEDEILTLSKDINIKSEDMYMEAMNFLDLINNEASMIKLGVTVNEKLLVRAVIHDIKNNFNRILGFSSVLADGDSNLEEASKYARVILSSSENANFLANNFLIFEGTDLNKAKIDISEIKLAKFTDNFIEILEQKAEDKKINFENKIDADINVMADSAMLQSVLTNLITNAIKFTNPNGNVVVSCEQKNDKVEIYIVDDGQGLTEEKKNNFFNNLGSTTIGTNREKGTGIGVYVCKKMVDAMNGSICVESEGKDKGTKITITLPAVLK